jgi:hypothetical protein
MKHIEAAKQALEALEMCRGLIRNNIEKGVAIESPNPFFSADVDIAIKDLRQAIKQEQQIPPSAYSNTHQQEPVQVTIKDFVAAVEGKEDFVGRPVYWAQWPNKDDKGEQA